MIIKRYSLILLVLGCCAEVSASQSPPESAATKGAPERVAEPVEKHVLIDFNLLSGPIQNLQNVSFPVRPGMVSLMRNKVAEEQKCNPRYIKFTNKSAEKLDEKSVIDSPANGTSVPITVVISVDPLKELVERLGVPREFYQDLFYKSFVFNLDEECYVYIDSMGQPKPTDDNGVTQYLAYVLNTSNVKFGEIAGTPNPREFGSMLYYVCNVSQKCTPESADYLLDIYKKMHQIYHSPNTHDRSPVLLEELTFKGIKVENYNYQDNDATGHVDEYVDISVDVVGDFKIKFNQVKIREGVGLPKRSLEVLPPITPEVLRDYVLGGKVQGITLMNKTNPFAVISFNQTKSAEMAVYVLKEIVPQLPAFYASFLK